MNFILLCIYCTSWYWLWYSYILAAVEFNTLLLAVVKFDIFQLAAAVPAHASHILLSFPVVMDWGGAGVGGAGGAGAGGAAVAGEGMREGIQHLHAPRQMISVSEARKVKGKEALTEQTPPCTVQAKVALSKDLLAFTSIFYFFISFLWPQEEVSLSALRFYSILYTVGWSDFWKKIWAHVML